MGPPQRGQATLVTYCNTTLMKTPMPVRLIAAFFGMIALTMTIGWTSLFISDVSQQPYNVQFAFIAIGLIVVGVSSWICLGLIRGSRDARAITLTLCWLGFLITPISMLGFLSNAPTKTLGVGLGELAIFFSIYRVLTSPSIRQGFFRCR